MAHIATVSLSGTAPGVASGSMKMLRATPFVLRSGVAGRAAGAALGDGPVIDIRRATGFALAAYGVLLVTLGVAAWHCDFPSRFLVSLYTGAAAIALAVAVLAFRATTRG